MKALLDNNIIIHREAARVISADIGILFNWLDRLRYDKCVHPASFAEFAKLHPSMRESFNIKLDAYIALRVQSDLDPNVAKVSAKHDVNDNDRTDTLLLNEVYTDRVDILITEDK